MYFESYLERYLDKFGNPTAINFTREKVEQLSGLVNISVMPTQA